MKGKIAAMRRPRDSFKLAFYVKIFYGHGAPVEGVGAVVGRSPCLLYCIINESFTYFPELIVSSSRKIFKIHRRIN